MLKNGTLWLDVDGNPIQAHGGMIAEFQGTYYWYGEHKGADNCPGTTRVDVIGISCYTSSDLHHWHYEGLVLEAKPEDSDSFLHPSRVCERPKVIYNKKNQNYVMWFHADDAKYGYAGVGVAVADCPVGPFHLVRVMQPNRLDSRDMTLFQDTDGRTYLYHSSNFNKTMCITRLNEDDTDVTPEYHYALTDQEREAPAVFEREGTYYMITSGCTGWSPNASLTAIAKHPCSGWKLIDNPCVGPEFRKTFQGQGTYVLNVQGTYYLMLDHWKPRDLKNSGYSILPITFTEDGIEVVWQDEF